MPYTNDTKNSHNAAHQRRSRRPAGAASHEPGGTACRIIFIRDGQVLRVPVLQTSRRAAS
jgi:hypothetical protein